MSNEDAESAPSPQDDTAALIGEYLQRAADAAAEGNPTIAMHLYLAAFEIGQQNARIPVEESITAIKRAWSLAYGMRERSIAEYVFERMEPFLSNAEVAACAEQLQELALDKLEEFGLSREELEDMTDMISQDIMSADPRLLRVEHLTTPGKSANGLPPSSATCELGMPEGGTFENGRFTPDPGLNRRLEEEAGLRPCGATPADAGSSKGSASGMPPFATHSVAPAAASAEDASRAVAVDPVMGDEDHLTYAELVGYDKTVEAMRSLGIGMQHDEEFQQLVCQLNSRHGLERMPACDTLLITSPAREDANHFMMATIGELGLPVIRMRMEENMQGMPVLCVMAQADNQPKLNAARNAFEAPGVLVIEDVDMWAAPDMEPNSVDDFGGLLMASLSRGAREAVNLIRNASDDPDVFVFATAASGCEVDPFFLDLFGLTTAIDIDYPTDAERAGIWMQIAREHPSVRGIDRDLLVRFSAGMPRYDMYMAAREAVEEAYKESLSRRKYVPVSADNLFDKLAAYQPLDSPEYKALEQAVIDDFRQELDHIDDLLKGAGE